MPARGSANLMSPGFSGVVPEFATGLDKQIAGLRELQSSRINRLIGAGST